MVCNTNPHCPVHGVKEDVPTVEGEVKAKKYMTLAEKGTLIAIDPTAKYEYRNEARQIFNWCEIGETTRWEVMLDNDYIIRKVEVKLSVEDQLRDLLKRTYENHIASQKYMRSWSESETKKSMEAIK